MHASFLGVTLVLATLVAADLRAPAAESRTPDPSIRLVAWITIDQLPAATLGEFLDSFEPGGFRELAQRGVFYRRATYDHAVTFTATGHATLFTGQHPCVHGVIANEWARRENGEEVACVEDPTETLLGEPTKPHQGTSPRNLLAPTVGDFLGRASEGRSRVFSVSFKDRGAILPGGHLGKAFWFSTGSGHFVSSTYYYSQLPGWVEAWNAKRPIEAWRGREWPLLQDRGSYRRANQDDRPYERDHYGLGRTFPHPFPGPERKDLAAALACTPMGDEFTLQFVAELLRQERLGLGNTPDLLAISFSSTDMVGHIYGPDSLEAEDNLYRIDRVLAQLLELLRSHVGAEHLLWVLSSDHGMGPIPETVAAQHGASPDPGCCGRHDRDAIVARAQAELTRQFKFSEPVLAAFWTPWLYLNETSVRRQGARLVEVERALADFVGSLPGVDSVWSRSDLAAGRVPDGPLGIWLEHAFHADRAGHVLVLPKPDWYLYNETQKYAATHGTHYDHDRTVPIMVMGPGLAPAVVGREVHPDALAHAVAVRLGLREPRCEPARQLKELVGP